MCARPLFFQLHRRCAQPTCTCAPAPSPRLRPGTLALRAAEPEALADGETEGEAGGEGVDRRRVDEGDADALLGQPPDARVIARRLAPNRRLLCASPAYLQSQGTPTRLEDLASHRCLVHALVMAVQSLQDPMHGGHLLGDVPALVLVAVVLGLLMKRQPA